MGQSRRNNKVLNKNELSVTISEIYNYKLKILFNPRTLPMDECDFIYSNWDDSYENYYR